MAWNYVNLKNLFYIFQTLTKIFYDGNNFFKSITNCKPNSSTLAKPGNITIVRVLNIGSKYNVDGEYERLYLSFMFLKFSLQFIFYKIFKFQQTRFIK